MEDKDWTIHPSLVAELKRRLSQPHPVNTASIYDRLDREVKALNDTEGDLSGRHCETCKDKGVVYVRNGEYIEYRTCSCMPARRAMWRIERSGLGESLQRCTFETFQALEPWQKAMKAAADRFVEDHSGAWFFAGGQPGAGKTHICTAIVGELLKRGKEARYMLWKDEATYLKAHINEDAYETRIGTLKTVEVLYIDDFFKTPYADDGTRRRPTAGDLNLAFEILNARYVGRLTTLITSERTIDELLDIDEAVGSRIYERSKGYAYNLAPDRAKNWRLRV